MDITSTLGIMSCANHHVTSCHNRSIPNLTCVCMFFRGCLGTQERQDWKVIRWSEYSPYWPVSELHVTMCTPCMLASTVPIGQTNALAVQKKCCLLPFVKLMVKIFLSCWLENVDWNVVQYRYIDGVTDGWNNRWMDGWMEKQPSILSVTQIIVA